MLSTFMIIWMYLIGLWIFYESIAQAAEDDNVELQMDFFGGLMLLLWFVSYPLMTVWAVFFGPDEDE